MLASKFTRKQKKTDPRLVKRYRLYGIKQVWTAHTIDLENFGVKNFIKLILQ